MRNKYPGVCFRCGSAVPAGKGHFQREKGRWLIRCLPCVGKGNEPVKPPVQKESTT